MPPASSVSAVRTAKPAGDEEAALCLEIAGEYAELAGLLEAPANEAYSALPGRGLSRRLRHPGGEANALTSHCPSGCVSRSPTVAQYVTRRGRPRPPSAGASA